MTWESYIDHKKVIYITTKNLDYIRVVQELKILKEKTETYKVIGSYSMKYPVRIISVYLQLLCASFRPYDTIFIGFAPQLVLPVWFWKLRKANLIIDFFVSFYDTLCCDRKIIKQDSIMGRLLHWLDQWVLGRADYIICDANSHGRYFADEFLVTADKLATLYLEADTTIYHQLYIQRPERLKDKYIVLYFGSGFPLQGIDIVLKAMDLLKDNKLIYFFFIGSIRDRTLKMCKPVSDNIKYIKWVSQQKLAEYIDMADLCLAGHFNADIQKAGRVIAGKAFIYQAMGKRMILGDNEANRELFAEDEQAVFVKMGDERALAERILNEYRESSTKRENKKEEIKCTC